MQVSACDVCNWMYKPPHMPETSETCYTTQALQCGNVFYIGSVLNVSIRKVF